MKKAGDYIIKYRFNNNIPVPVAESLIRQAQQDAIDAMAEELEKHVIGWVDGSSVEDVANKLKINL